MSIYGKCKYCGNPRIVEGADGSELQEIRDEWATEQCDCVSLHVFMLRLKGNILQSSRILLGMALSSLVLLSCGL